MKYTLCDNVGWVDIADEEVRAVYLDNIGGPVIVVHVKGDPATYKICDNKENRSYLNLED